MRLLAEVDRLTAERAEARDNAEAAEELAREADTERKTVEAELAALRIEHAAQAAVIDGLRATVAQLRSDLADEQQRREAAEDFIADIPAMLDGRIDTSGAWSGGIPEMGAALDAIRAVKAELDWYIDRHGTRAKTEAEDAKVEAELARVGALSDDECKAELAAEGIDYDASRKRMDVLIRVLTERTTLRAKVMDVERERDELAALRIEHEAVRKERDDDRDYIDDIAKRLDALWDLLCSNDSALPKDIMVEAEPGSHLIDEAARLLQMVARERDELRAALSLIRSGAGPHDDWSDEVREGWRRADAALAGGKA